MITNDVVLLRLVWHPCHIVDGKVQSAAFERDDLLAIDDRYVSVDDHSLASEESVTWRIEWLQRDGRADRLRRQEAFFAELLARNVRSCVCASNAQLFQVTREPTEAEQEGPGSPQNMAHCGIRTIQAERFTTLGKREKNAAVERMRTQLIKNIERLLSFEEVFDEA